MRLIVAAAVGVAAAALAACANLGSPPGGPVRTTPPVLTGTNPDSGAVNVTARGVTFQFDAQVGDRGIEEFFLVSPREGTPRIRWRRSRVEVRPGRDFRPNTAYSVTMLPGITDLNGNRINEPRTIVFSTGPTIPATAIRGRVFDWATERVAANARVEAIRLPDSLPYVGVADSAGLFTLGPLDDGTYVVRAVVDNNRNRAADPTEPWDSVRVEVRGGSPNLELLAILRDTLPPRVLTAAAPDSVTVVATFDRSLAPGQPFATLFRLLRQDSTPVRIARVLTRAERDSILQRADTSDTTRVAPTNPLVQALANRLGEAPAPGDLRPSRRTPPQELTIEIDPATPLVSGTTYRLHAVGVRALNGRPGTSDRVFEFRARRDTVP